MLHNECSYALGIGKCMGSVDTKIHSKEWAIRDRIPDSFQPDCNRTALLCPEKPKGCKVLFCSKMYKKKYKKKADISCLTHKDHF